MSYHPNCTISGPDNFGRRWESRVAGSERALIAFHAGSVLCAVSGLSGDSRDAERYAARSARACVKLARLAGRL